MAILRLGNNNSAFSGSFSGSYTGDGSQLTNLPASSTFPFTGDAQITGSLTISGSFNSFTVDSDNIVLGAGAGIDMLAGANANVIIGNNAGANLTSGDSNTFIGNSAGATMTTYHYNVAIGDLAMANTADASTYNVAMGYKSLRYGSGIIGNVGIGYEALTGVGGMNGDYNVGIGYGAGDTIRDGISNTFVGHAAGGNINDGDKNVAIGYAAGSLITDGDDNIAIGNLSGRGLITGVGNIVIGTSASIAGDASGMLVIGSGSVATISASLSTGDVHIYNTASAAVFSGSTYYGDGSNLTNLPASSTFPFTGDAVITGSLTISGSFNAFTVDVDDVVIGDGAGASMQANSAGYNVLIGKNAGSLIVTYGVQNVSIGREAGTGDANSTIAIGSYAAHRFKYGKVGNIGVGYYALSCGGATYGNITDGEYNTAIGHTAGRNICDGIGNTMLGAYAGRNFGGYNVGGDGNIAVGYYAGFNQTSGDGNITIGSGSLGVAAESNQLRIGNGESITTISASLATGDVIFASTASAAYFSGDGSQLTNLPGGGSTFPFTGDAVITGSLIISASATSQSLSVIGSGSTQFDVIGSVGTLFSVDDDLTGMLFTTNDISGLPVLQASASGETFIGKSPQSLYTTAVISATSASSTASVYALSTSSYDGVFFDYTITSASNAKAGSIMSVWNGGTITHTETTTTDIGSTSGITFNVIISQSQAQLVAVTDSTDPNIWKVKTIIKAI